MFFLTNPLTLRLGIRVCFSEGEGEGDGYGDGQDTKVHLGSEGGTSYGTSGTSTGGYRPTYGGYSGIPSSRDP